MDVVVIVVTVTRGADRCHPGVARPRETTRDDPGGAVPPAPGAHRARRAGRGRRHLGRPDRPHLRAQRDAPGAAARRRTSPANPVVRERIAGAEPGRSAPRRRSPSPSRTMSGLHVGAARRHRRRSCWSPPTPRQVGHRATLGPQPGAGRGRRGPAPGTRRGTRRGRRAGAGVRPSDRRGRRAWPRSGATCPSVWSRLGDVVPNLLVYLGVASVLGPRRLAAALPPGQAADPRHGAGRDRRTGRAPRGAGARRQGGRRSRSTSSGRVTVVNDSARQLLAAADDCVGRRLDDLDLDPQLVEVLTSRQPGPDRLVLVGDRVLALNRRPMRSHGQVIGSVTTLRDRTELSALERELGTSRATSDTLRAQTHEFANQLHTICGLLQLEEYDEVRALRRRRAAEPQLAVRRGHLAHRRRDRRRPADRQGQPRRASGAWSCGSPPTRASARSTARWRATSRPSSATWSTTRWTPRPAAAGQPRVDVRVTELDDGRHGRGRATPGPGVHQTPRTVFRQG